MARPVTNPVLSQTDMLDNNDRDVRTRVREEANAWLLRIHSGTMSDPERHEFSIWRGNSPVHESEFLEAERFWVALDGLAGQVTRHKRESPGTGPRVHRWPITIAAMLALIATVALLWPSIDARLSDYRTDPGKQASITLTDGSTVHLNTQSALSVDLSDRRRSLTLKQGEALFEVAHDASRPFEVTVNGGVVRAIGTVFNINTRASRTTVTVLEGMVRVVHKERTQDIPAGYRLAYKAENVPGNVEPANLPQATAWRKGEFVFDDMPFALIVEELNRYRTVPIFIVDQELRGHRLSGSVMLDDSEHSLQMLQNVLPFRTLHVTPYLTILSS